MRRSGPFHAIRSAKLAKGAIALTLLIGPQAWAQPATLQETGPEFQEAIWCQLALGGIGAVMDLNDDEKFVAEIGYDLFVEKVYDLGAAQGMDEVAFRRMLEQAAPVVERDMLTARYGDYRMIDYCFAQATERYHELAQCEAEQRLTC